MNTFPKRLIKRALMLATWYVGELPDGVSYYLDGMDDEGITLDIEITIPAHFYRVQEILGNPPITEGEMHVTTSGGALRIEAYMMPGEEETK